MGYPELEISEYASIPALDLGIPPSAPLMAPQQPGLVGFSQQTSSEVPMNKTAVIATTIALAFLGCSKDAKLPPKVFEAALARTTNLAEGQQAHLSGFQRSFYGSAKYEHYYCVDFLAKRSLNDLIIVTVYDDTTGGFRPIEGGRIVRGLTLAINDELLKPQKTFIMLAIQQAPQPNDSKK